MRFWSVAAALLLVAGYSSGAGAQTPDEDAPALTGPDAGAPDADAPNAVAPGATVPAVPVRPAAAAGTGKEGYSHADFTPVGIGDWRALRNARPLPSNTNAIRSGSAPAGPNGQAGGPAAQGLTTGMAQPPAPNPSRAHGAAGGGATLAQSGSSAGSIGAQAPVDIQELARALKYDNDLIYEFVRDNIETVPVFGVQKGWRGALIDRQGTNFDQAELMFELLNAAGKEAYYVFTVIRLTPEQVRSFYGINTDKACAVQYFFAAGQIPNTLLTSAGDTCESPFRGILLNHLFVREVFRYDNGQIFGHIAWDPSMKPHTVKPGIDLAAATGYNSTNYLAAARAGATVTATTAKDLNRANIRSSLTTYSNNLISNIRATKPAGGLEDIIGGKVITPPAALASGLGLQSYLPYQDQPYQEANWGDYIPNDMRVLLRITYPGVDYLILPDYYYGKRLTISPNAALQPVLAADGEEIAVGNPLPAGWAANLRIEVVHSAYPQRFANQVFTRTISSGETHFLTVGLGPTTSALGDIFRKQAAAATKAGVDPSSEPALGASLGAIAADWQAQWSASTYLTDRIARTNTKSHHQIGLIGNRGGPYVDLPAVSYTVAHETGDANRQAAATYSHTFHGSAFESVVLQQVVGTSAVSTVHLIDQAVGAGETIFSATAANYTAGVQPNLVNCNANFAAFNSLTANGVRLILPQNCARTENNWTGFGYLTTEGQGSGVAIGAMIAGGYNGGYITIQRPPEDWIDRLQRDAPPWLRWWMKKRGDPIDMATGAFFYSHDDLTVGNQGFPYGLGFQTIYTSAKKDDDGPLGLGWTHNFAITAKPVTLPLQGLGEDSPIDAATSIVESMVALDLLADPAVPVDKLVTAMLGQRWFSDQLENNAVMMTDGEIGELFVKLSDGTYNAPPLSSGRLTRNADGTYAYSTVTKDRLDFGADGNISKRSSPSGFEVRFAYANGKLAAVQNSFGRQLSLTYSGDKLISVADDNGRSVGYAYDSAGNLGTFTNAALASTVFQYDLPGRMTKYFLPANPAVAQVTNTYDSLGRIKEQLTADSKLWKYYFAGNRSTEESPDGHLAIDYFSGTGEFLGGFEDCIWSETGGNYYCTSKTRLFYDSLGRVVRQIGSRTPLVEFTYDDASCNSAEKRCTHNVTKLRQVAINDLAYTTTVPDLIRNFTYEPQYNRLATSANARGKVTNYAYDSVGNLTSVTLPPPVDAGTLRPQTTLGYTAFAGAPGYPNFTLLTSRTRKIDATNSVTTNLGYNAANRYVPSTMVVDAGGLNLTTGYGYDAVGNLTSVDGPRTDVTDVTQFGYDPERRHTSTTDARGKVSLVAYNADGDAIRSTAQIGLQWAATCTARLADGKVAQIAGPALVADDSSCPAAAAPVAVTDLTYDNYGRLLTSTINRTATQGGNRTSQFGYTPTGELISTTMAVGTPLQQVSESVRVGGGGAPSNNVQSAGAEYAYSSANAAAANPSYPAANKKVQLDAHGRIRSRWYDSVACPGTRTSYGCDQYEYDADGNLTKWTRRDGQIVSFAYDNIGRVTQRTAPTTTDNVAYTYDLLGRMLTANGSSNVSYVYDKASRMTSSTTVAGTVGYQYNPAGNRTRTTWPGNSFYVTYDYDVLGRVSAVKENGTALLAGYAYDDLSRRTGVSYGNATSAAYGYDSQARLGTLTLDLAGTAGDVTRTYGYDRAGALSSQTTSNSNYDWNGYYNVSRAYTNDGEDLYKTSGTKTLTYDLRGNLAGDGTWTFAYDFDNRLKTAGTKSGTSLAYTYDTVGRLVTRAVGRTAGNRFLYDGNQLIGEYSSTGTLIRRFVRGPAMDEALVVYDGTGATTKTWLYSDHEGSVTATATAAGELGSALSYGPFGEPNVTTGVALRYTGQRLDSDSGLYYYKSRWYSPYLGRFLSPDPAFVSDGLHLYAYVGNDPVNYTDPSGNWRQAGRTIWRNGGRTLADWTPILGDGLAIRDAWNHPTALGIAAAGVGLVPLVGDGIGKVLRHADEVGDAARRLPDDALVCRGGTCTAERFENGSGVTIDANGNLQGVSVESAAGVPLQELTRSIPHPKVGVTTVGDVRAAGGDVFTSAGRSPYHCTLCGITPAQAQQLFTPPVPNPNK
jgi:RHS repeat-associated protein